MLAPHDTWKCNQATYVAEYSATKAEGELLLRQAWIIFCDVLAFKISIPLSQNSHLPYRRWLIKPIFFLQACKDNEILFIAVGVLGVHSVKLNTKESSFLG